MKKSLLVFMIIASVFVSCAMPVVADAKEIDADAGRLVASAFDGDVADGEIKFTVSLTDIAAENGVVLVEYWMIFDSAKLEYVSCDAPVPDEWADDSEAEIWAQIAGEKFLYAAMTMSESGITADHSITATYTFKILDESSDHEIFITRPYYLSLGVEPTDPHYATQGMGEYRIDGISIDTKTLTSKTFDYAAAEKDENHIVHIVTEKENETSGAESGETSSAITSSVADSDASLTTTEPDERKNTKIIIAVSAGAAVIVIGIMIAVIMNKKKK